MKVTIKNIFENFAFLKKKLIIYANINKKIKVTNIKKKKLFTKIMSTSLMLFLMNSTNGNRYIIYGNKMGLKFTTLINFYIFIFIISFNYIGVYKFYIIKK